MSEDLEQGPFRSLNDSKEIWDNALNGSRSTSVFIQIVDLISSINFYTILLQAREYCPPGDSLNEKENVNIHVSSYTSDELARKMNAWFWESTLTKLRKLLEKAPLVVDGNKNDRSVISLSSVISDMYSQFKTSGSSASISAINTLYDEYNTWLKTEGPERLSEIVNKVIAHQATESSMKKSGFTEDYHVCLADLEGVLRTLCKYFHSTNAIIGFSDRSFLFNFAGDIVSNLDHPLARTEDLDSLRLMYNALSEKAGKW